MPKNEIFWTPDDADKIKELKARKSDLEELSDMCYSTMGDIFGLLLDNPPSVEGDDAAHTTLDSMSRLIAIVNDYNAWLTDVLEQLEGRHRYLKCAFSEEDILWSMQDADS